MTGTSFPVNESSRTQLHGHISNHTLSILENVVANKRAVNVERLELDQSVQFVLIQVLAKLFHVPKVVLTFRQRFTRARPELQNVGVSIKKVVTLVTFGDSEKKKVYDTKMLIQNKSIQKTIKEHQKTEYHASMVSTKSKNRF